MNRVDNTFKDTSEILIAAKAALKVVQRVMEVVEVAPNFDGEEHSNLYAVLAASSSSALEIATGDNDDASIQVNLSSVEPKVSQPKKAKVSVDLNEGTKEMIPFLVLHIFHRRLQQK